MPLSSFPFQVGDIVVVNIQTRHHYSSYERSQHGKQGRVYRNFPPYSTCVVIGDSYYEFLMGDLQHFEERYPTTRNLVSDNEVYGGMNHREYDSTFISTERARLPLNLNHRHLDIEHQNRLAMPCGMVWYDEMGQHRQQCLKEDRCSVWYRERLNQFSLWKRHLEKNLDLITHHPEFEEWRYWGECGAWVVESRHHSRQTGKAVAVWINTLKSTSATDDEKFVAIHKLALTRTVVRDREVNVVRQQWHTVNARHNGEWKSLPEVWRSNFHAHPSQASLRHPHVSKTNPLLIAYYQTWEKFKSDVLTLIKPGRFLAKFYPSHPVVDNETIKSLVSIYNSHNAPQVLHVADTQEDIITVIDEGPSESCQSRAFHDTEPGDEWFKGHIHPAACYASGDFLVLYMTNDRQPANRQRLQADEQRITARCIVNAEKKYASRIYGDEALMLPLVRAAGYEQRSEALKRCRLLKIKNERGSGYIMPYVDAGYSSGGGSLCFTDYDYDHWHLVSDGESTYCGYDNKGVYNEDGDDTVTCPNCDEQVNEDDLQYSPHHGEQFCCHCEGDYTHAIVSHYGDRDYVRNDEVIYLDDRYYLNDSAVLERCGFVECHNCGDWATVDDTTSVDEGQVCDSCGGEVCRLAEESPDGHHVGYKPNCTQYVDVTEGEWVWLHDDSVLGDYTTINDDGDEVPRYVTEDEWCEMQCAQDEATDADADVKI